MGPNWPNAGEIDVLEGVNNQKGNQYTLHSGNINGTCTLDKNINKASAKAFTANVVGTECVSSGANNAGCGFSDPDPTSFGEGFNNASGGVFAHLWDSTGIKAWHFARNRIPSDIAAKNPNPKSWPTPAAVWSSQTCDINRHFFDHALTIDTTICGDWAGSDYVNSGCPGTCSDIVADPKNFASEYRDIVMRSDLSLFSDTITDAKWKVNYIAVYQ